jgi:XTP/dITP diphosphohydrolase
MEAIADRPLSDYTIEELERFWQQAKALMAQEH